jgi:hypothetical protein
MVDVVLKRLPVNIMIEFQTSTGIMQSVCRIINVLKSEMLLYSIGLSKHPGYDSNALLFSFLVKEYLTGPFEDQEENETTGFKNADPTASPAMRTGKAI